MLQGLLGSQPHPCLACLGLSRGGDARVFSALLSAGLNSGPALTGGGGWGGGEIGAVEELGGAPARQVPDRCSVPFVAVRSASVSVLTG